MTNKLKMELGMERHNLAEANNANWWDINLDHDITEAAFDSQNQWQSMMTLPVEDRWKLIHGCRAVNAFDGHNPILISDFAEAICADQPTQLTLPVQFAVCFKYAEFLARLQRYYAVSNVSDESFNVDEIGVRIINSESNKAVYSTATYLHVCGGRILVQSAPSTEG
jgi:hypothetical protein